MIAMHALCQDDFGPDVRMCTSEEFWLSPNAEAPAADAWLHPTLVPGLGDFSAGGGGEAQFMSCNGWRSAFDSSRGLVVTTAGKPDILLGCDMLRPVTCCAPIQ